MAAAFYRKLALADMALPCADETDSAACALLEEVDAMSGEADGGLLPRRTELLVNACVRRLRKSGDGGEADLDKQLAPNASVVPVDGWPGADGQPEWVLPSGSSAPSGGGRRMLFLHGGGYTNYSPAFPYRPLTTRLAESFGMPVLCVDYRLAPQHPFPAAVEDALFALAWLWDHGPPLTASDASWHASKADAVYVCGDSAGGGLALALIAALALGESAPGVPLPPSCAAREAVLPTALALMSPWTDLTASLPTYTTRLYDAHRESGDPVFSDGDPASEIQSAVECGKVYTGGSEALLRDPRVSPVFLPHALLRAWLPPTMMVVGDAEVMLADATEVMARAVEAGVPADQLALRVYRRMWHVFPMYTEACGQVHAGGAEPSGGRGLPHAWHAIRQLARWVDEHHPTARPVGSPRRTLQFHPCQLAAMVATLAMLALWAAPAAR